MSDVLIPVARFRPIAEAWVAQHDRPEEAYQALAAASGRHVHSWRKRLTYRPESSSWLFPVEIDEDDVDEFLTAAGLTHLWQTELRDLLPEPRLSDDEFDETCAECGRWIDWSRGDAGIRVEVKRPHRWTLWWSLCSICACETLYIKPRHPSGSGRYKPKDIPERIIRDLYRRYVLEQIGITALAEKIYEQYGWPTANACEAWLSRKWRQIGFPIRSISESKVANRKNGHKWRHRIPIRALRQAHALHTRADVSVNQLGRQFYRRYGYASHTTCAMAIANGWRQLGLQPRERLEMTVAVSTKHGQCRRNAMSSEKKRFLAHQRGERATVAPIPCAAKTARGKPCGRHAIAGKTLCYNHDPDRADERAAACERLRVNSPFDPENTIAFGDVPERLTAWFETNGRRWKRLTEITGKSNTSLKHFASKAPDDRTMPETKALLERALDQLAHEHLEAAA